MTIANLHDDHSVYDHRQMVYSSNNASTVFTKTTANANGQLLFRCSTRNNATQLLPFYYHIFLYYIIIVYLYIHTGVLYTLYMLYIKWRMPSVVLFFKKGIRIEWRRKVHSSVGAVKNVLEVHTLQVFVYILCVCVSMREILFAICIYISCMKRYSF